MHVFKYIFIHTVCVDKDVAAVFSFMCWNSDYLLYKTLHMQRLVSVAIITDIQTKLCTLESVAIEIL